MEGKIDSTYFGFSVGIIDVALPVHNILKVVPLPQLKYLPNLPDCVIGLLNYHGEVFPIFDLRIKFKLTERKISITQNILLGEVDDFKFGILTTKIIGNIEKNEQHLITDKRIKTDSSEIGNFINHKDDFVYVCDPLKFLLPEEKENLSSILKKDD
ncbi:MAG: chemotaxis protein CheW [Bacteroidetes bacterium]|nr:chemotaxis protein CheW [Bacteroidota bacterium]